MSVNLPPRSSRPWEAAPSVGPAPAEPEADPVVGEPVSADDTIIFVGRSKAGKTVLVGRCRGQEIRPIQAGWIST